MKCSLNIIPLLLACPCHGEKEITQAIERVKEMRSLEGKNITKNIQFVLTRQASELTDDALVAVTELFDKQILEFFRLTQSANVGRKEYAILNISSNVQSQIVDSVFVLGAAGVLNSIGVLTRTRSRLLQTFDNSYIYLPQEGKLRSLQGDSNMGIIVSSLLIDVSSKINLNEDEEGIAPDILAHVRDFFSPAGSNSLSFMDSAQKIQDKFGNYPLMNITNIDIGKTPLWESPYNYLDEQQEQNSNPLPLGQRNAPTNAGNKYPGTSVTTGISPTWIGIAVGGTILAIAAIISGVLVSQMVKRSKKQCNKRGNPLPHSLESDAQLSHKSSPPAQDVANNIEVGRTSQNISDNILQNQNAATPQNDSNSEEKHMEKMFSPETNGPVQTVAQLPAVPIEDGVGCTSLGLGSSLMSIFGKSLNVTGDKPERRTDNKSNSSFFAGTSTTSQTVSEKKVHFKDLDLDMLNLNFHHHLTNMK